MFIFVPRVYLKNNSQKSFFTSLFFWLQNPWHFCFSILCANTRVAFFCNINHSTFQQIPIKINDLCQGRRKVGAGGALAPPIFGRSANPILTRGDTLSPPSTTSPPGISDLATALLLLYCLMKFLL